MATDKASIITLLSKQYLFRGLDQSQINRVASRFEPMNYQAGAIIVPQGSPGDSFYVVLEGRVRVTHYERGRQRDLGTLTAGDFFGEEALLFDRPRSATVTTVVPTEVLHLSRQHFLEIIEEFPQIRRNLSATAESRQITRKEKFDWLGENEVVYLICRKHRFFLLRALAMPVMAGLAAISILALGLGLGLDLSQSTEKILFIAIEVVGGLIAIVAFGWGLWKWLDWGNDYYIVTNRRVLWLEKVIGAYDSRNEAPLDTVLSVGTRISFWGRRFDYGNVEVRTYAGSIVLQNTAQPERLAAFIEGFRQRAALISKEAELAAIEKALREAIRKRSGQDADQPVSPPQAPPTPKEQKGPGRLRRSLQKFLRVRYAEDGVITYRKHWFVLFRKAWASSLALLGLLSLVILLLWLRSLDKIDLELELPLLAVIGAIVLGILLWLSYNYMDWSNDIYRITPSQILDIEKKPLGTEKKQFASLDAPDFRIEHERIGLLGILLNIGTVTISVGQTKFNFYNVVNPDQVHQDIANYREALNRRKRAIETARERERMINWLMAFYQETGNMEETRIRLEASVDSE